MSDHIGEATQKVIDLDALEKLASRIKSAGDDRRYPRFSDMEAASDGLTALIAELKEAREHLARCVELVPAPGAIDAADAFLARNGEGKG